jgi:hypothetical protein
VSGHRPRRPAHLRGVLESRSRRARLQSAVGPRRGDRAQRRSAQRRGRREQRRWRRERVLQALPATSSRTRTSARR